jgi:hypothetical protein
MLAEQLFQTLQNLEILRRLDWEVGKTHYYRNTLELWLKTRISKQWFRINIDPQKDKPFRYFHSQMSKLIEAETEKEIAVWLLSDFCTFYVLLLLRWVLEPLLGHTPFNVLPNKTYDKGSEFYLVADKIAVVTTHIIRQPDYNENGVIVVQVPQNLNPDWFYAALAYHKEGEMLIGLNDNYPTIVHILERMLALSAL